MPGSSSSSGTRRGNAPGARRRAEDTMLLRGLLGMAAGLGMLGGLAVTSAEGMPIAPPASLSADTAVTLVRDGCGPGYVRTPYGRCRPGGGYRGRGYDRPPRFFGGPGYGGRRCVIRNTYDGPRRICR